MSTLSRSAEALIAARALKAMNDPIVVPYLELAASRTRSGEFVDALQAMSAPEARVALERLAHSQDPEVRTLAPKALSK